MVLLVLVGAAIMLGLVLLPQVVGDSTAQRQLASAGSVGHEDQPSRNETPADEPGKEAAAPATETSKDELVPHGDHNIPRDEAIRGRIIDKDNEPVADAIVVAVYKEYRTQPYQLILASKVRSEEDGFFILGPLERQSYYILAIKKDVGVGYATGQMPGAWVELALAPGASVTGKVTAREGGAPVAGATAPARPLAGGSSPPATHPESVRVLARLAAWRRAH